MDRRISCFSAHLIPFLLWGQQNIRLSLKYPIWTCRWIGQTVRHESRTYIMCTCILCKKTKQHFNFSLSTAGSTHPCICVLAGWPAGGGSRCRSAPRHRWPRGTLSAGTWRGWDPVWTAPPGRETHRRQRGGKRGLQRTTIAAWCTFKNTELGSRRVELMHGNGRSC